MERLGTDEGLTKRYPVDYPIFEIGHNLNIKTTPKDNDRFVKVLNRARIPKAIKYDSDWLVAADGSKDIGTMDDFLETDEQEAVYAVTMGFRCDRELDITVKFPSAKTLYGVKNDTSMYLSPNDSPYDKPNIWFWTNGDTNIPSLKIENNTEYTPNTFEVYARGYKYRIADLNSKKQNYHTVILQGVNGGV